MDLNEIIAALKARCAAVFGDRIAGAAEYKRLPETSNLVVPAAYVIPMDDAAGEQQSQNAYRQLITDTFAVVVVLGNVVDERGQGSITSVAAMRSALCSALLGWQPTDYGPIQYEGGGLLDLDRARLYYQFEFSAETELIEADTWLATRNAALPTFETADLATETPAGTQPAAITLTIEQP